MILVGIDVASEKHDVAIVTERNLSKPLSYFTIPNREPGYKKLLGEIERAKKLFPDDKVRIGLESTGAYSVGLTEYLAKIYEDSVVLINPVLTSMFELSIHVHYAKTDKTDALGICKFLAGNQDIRPYAVVSYHTRQLRSLSRERNKINKRINQDVNRLKGLLHIAFPEFLSKKHDTMGLFELEFLKRYPTAESIKDMEPEDLRRSLKEVKYLRISLDKASKLVESAKASVGSGCLGDGIIIQTTAERIELFHDQKKRIDKEIVKIMQEDCPYLLTIPGIGAVTLGTIVGEIGDVRNYHGSDSIVALAGLNPIVYQSGNYNAMHTRISKKGSSYLRNAIYMATMTMFREKTEPIYSFVKKKRAEGKKKICSFDHGARKLVNILFSMMKNKQGFIDKAASTNS